MSKANRKKVDPYGDLEKPVEDVRNMSMIVSSMMDDAGGVQAGTVTIDRRVWETLSFAVHHLDELVGGLHGQYFRD
jgi:hypothetical protein